MNGLSDVYITVSIVMVSAAIIGDSGSNSARPAKAGVSVPLFSALRKEYDCQSITPAMANRQTVFNLALLNIHTNTPAIIGIIASLYFILFPRRYQYHKRRKKI